ncbi:hypothetical protein F8M41_007592 [Gigaspora margarita]|uniref:Uncharacterized protein n=1 Tax=Gigaspora margarita TaxID=4874 RepID=A0A8H4AW79_GIGMA|nr:hypothetical protein F8M41_007592 [Gigaspora margarita]
MHIRSKLLVTHNNFTECLKGVSENRGVSSSVQSDSGNRFESKSSNDSHASKRVRVEDFDDSVEEFCEDFVENPKGNANKKIPVALGGDVDGFCSSSRGGFNSLKCDDCSEDFEMSTGGGANEFDSFVDHNRDESEGSLKRNGCQKKSSCGKGKERADGSLRVNLRSRGFNSNSGVIKE